MKTKTRVVESGEKLFDVEDEPFPKGAWWWWFWLFTFDNPMNPKKPRQLMILWSTKNVKEIDCNGLKIKLDLPIDKLNMDGAVAAWYYDGWKMHHNFLLEQCHIRTNKRGLVTDSETPTLFTQDGDTYMVQIGDDMEFIAEADGKHDFLRPNHHGNHFVGNKGYSITKINRLSLSGTVDGKPITGNAYFQRVFVNAPAIPWFWGIYHFQKGAVLTYTYQWIMGKKLKRHIAFFDGKKLHDFDKINVKRIERKDFPAFLVNAENDTEKISFMVDTYEHSSWTFKKKSIGVIPNKLAYNEYPGRLAGFEFIDKNKGNVWTLKELGKAYGNSEHSTGFLF
jgi:hypothetical protein